MSLHPSWSSDTCCFLCSLFPVSFLSYPHVGLSKQLFDERSPGLPFCTLPLGILPSFLISLLLEVSPSVPPGPSEVSNEAEKKASASHPCHVVSRNSFVKRRISHLGFLFRFFSGVRAGRTVCLPGGPRGPTERAPRELLDLPSPFILPLPSCRGTGPPTSIMLARKVVTGLCFLLCVLFLCLVNRVSMETGAAFVLLLLWVNQCSPPPPLFGIKGGGGLITGTDREPCGGLGGRDQSSSQASPQSDCCLVSFLQRPSGCSRVCSDS